MAKKKKLNFDIKKHVLTPKHSVCSDAEKKRVLERYNITAFDLPLIFKEDAAIQDLEVKPGDVIKIVRDSPTAGQATFYRCVVNG